MKSLFDDTAHVIDIDAKSPILAMYLMYYLNESGTRVYTLDKTDPKGNPTFSAHPARFSPEDQVNNIATDVFQRKKFYTKLSSIPLQYSRQRITIKQRFNLLPTQQKPIKY